MSESTRERLEKIQQESITDAIEWGCKYGYRTQVKTKRIIEDVEWLIGQAERFEILSAQHDGALAENKRLREALEFYAKKDNHYLPSPGTDTADYYVALNAVTDDCGKLARAALEADNT